MSSGARNRVRARPPRGNPDGLRRLTEQSDIEAYLEDAAHYPGGYSSELCLPENEAQVAVLLREGRAVLAVGAQSSLTGGATPRGDTVVSTERMASILEWKDEAVVVEPGLLLAGLEEELGSRGLYYPPAPTFDGASIGGMVSTNAAGAATFKYGTTRAWVNALSVVLANGEVLDLRRGEVLAAEDGRFEIESIDGRATTLRAPSYVMPEVPKCSAGYYSRPGMDLVDLFVGSEGTLGIISSVELGLVPRRPGHFAGLVGLASEQEAVALVAGLRELSLETWRLGVEDGVDVAAVEYLDGRCLELLREQRSDRRAGVEIPRDAAVAILFQAETRADMTTAEAHEQLAAMDDPGGGGRVLALCRFLRDHGVFESTIPALPGEASRRDALFALREAVPAVVNERVGRASREVDPSISKSASDVIVPFERFGESLRRYREILEGQGLDHAIWGHISDGNVHTNVIARSGEEVLKANQAQLEIGRVAIELGGCPMSEHGVGRNPVKKALLEELYGQAGLAEMREIKKALDPRGLLSRGVLFD